MTSTRTAASLLAGALGAAALVLPACGAQGPEASTSGGDPLQGTPAAVVDAALHRTIDADTMSATMAATVKGLLSSEELEVDSRIDRASSRASFPARGAGETVEVVADGGDAYVTGTTPELRQALGDKTWLTGLPVHTVGAWTAEAFDPMTDLLYKLTGHGSVTRAGRDEVDGDRVTTYRFHVEDGVPAGVPAERHERVRKLVRATGAGRISTVAEVGIDDQGHVRSVDLDAEVRAASTTTVAEVADQTDVADEPLGRPAIELTWDAEVSDIGESVPIDVPDRSDSVELDDVPNGEELLGALQIGDA